MNILLLLTREDKVAKISRRLIRNKNINKVYICPIEYGCENKSKEISRIMKENHLLDYEFIDFLTEFNRNAFNYKDNYLKFIYDLGKKKNDKGLSLKEYFRFPGRDFSLWWFSLVHEKGPHKTEVFTYFIKIVSILNLKNKYNCEQIWLSPKSGIIYGVLFLQKDKLNTFLKSTKAIFIDFLKVIKLTLIMLKRIADLKIMAIMLGQRRMPKTDMWLVTPFPYIDENALKEGKWVNKFYGSLQSSIEKYHTRECVWLAMYAKVEPYKWKDAFRFLKELKRLNKPVFILEEWLNYRDLFRVLKIYSMVVSRFFKNILKLPSLFEYYFDDSNQSINLWNIYSQDFVSSFMGKVLLSGILYYYMFSKVVEDMPVNSKILYFCEMQIWEKALNVACSQRPDIIRIGMQHTIVPLLLLNYFNHPDELRGNDYINRVPTPDYLGCVGKTTKDIFLKSGWEEKKLFILGGFRFNSLKRYTNKEIKLNLERKNQIVVAFSLSPFENQEILRLLYDAFNDKALNFTILLKNHPCDSVEETAKKIGLKMNPNIFKFTSSPLSEIVPESMAMMVKESSSAFEALMSGIPVIVPYLYDIIDLCPLSGISNLPIYVSGPEQLFRVVNEIMNNDFIAHPELYRQFVNDYLHIYEDDKDYYKNLMQAYSHQGK